MVSDKSSMCLQQFVVAVSNITLVNQQTWQVWQVCQGIIKLIIKNMFFDSPLFTNIVQSIDKWNCLETFSS